MPIVYLTVTASGTLVVSSRLRIDYKNGRTYYPLHGTTVSVPAQQREQPGAELLQWHNENVFLR